MDYVLDAVEESIRDVMECFLENVKRNVVTKHVTESGDATENNNQFKSLPESNFNGDIETQKLTETSFDGGEPLPQTMEDELYDLVQKNQGEKNLDLKFKYFNRILTQFANSDHYIKKVRFMRLYLFLVITIGTFLYIKGLGYVPMDLIVILEENF